MHARARTAAYGVGPWSRCCGEYPCAQQEGRSAAAAHATPVCRRHCGPWRRQCTQAVWPRRSVTGAIPAYFWRAAAAAERWRGAPQATRRCGAKTGSAPERACTRSAWGARTPSAVVRRWGRSSRTTACKRHGRMWKHLGCTGTQRALGVKHLRPPSGVSSMLLQGPMRGRQALKRWLLG